MRKRKEIKKQRGRRILNIYISESEWEDQVGREKGMRERIQKDTVKKKSKGHFKVRMEIQNKRSFLKYLKPKNGEDRATTGHIFSPNEASSTRNGLNLTVLLAKGPHGNPQTTQTVVKTIGILLKLTARTY